MTETHAPAATRSAAVRRFERIVGRVTLEDVLEAHVEQLAALVVGLAACRGRDVRVASAQVHAMLDEAIAGMAAPTLTPPAAPNR
jgi:hypothetical protein